MPSLPNDCSKTIAAKRLQQNIAAKNHREYVFLYGFL
jgi:hypothetical protein